MNVAISCRFLVTVLIKTYFILNFTGEIEQFDNFVNLEGCVGER